MGMTLEQAIQAVQELSTKVGALESQNKELISLKGRMGREMGELRAAVEKTNKPYSSPKGYEEMTEEEATKIVDGFSKNPKKVLFELFTEFVNPFTKKIDGVENMLNYFGVVEKHPEYRTREYQDEVEQFRSNWKEQHNQDLGTMEAIDRLKLSKKEVELTTKEKALAGQVEGQKKAGQFGDGVGGGTGPDSADGSKSPQDILKANILQHRGTADGTPF